MVKANRRVKCRRLGMAATLAIITFSAECPWFVQAQTEGKVPQTGARSRYRAAENRKSTGAPCGA